MKITPIKTICGATSLAMFVGNPPLFLNTYNINISIFINVCRKMCFFCGVHYVVKVVECAAISRG